MEKAACRPLRRQGARGDTPILSTSPVRSLQIFFIYFFGQNSEQTCSALKHILAMSSMLPSLETKFAKFELGCYITIDEIVYIQLREMRFFVMIMLCHILFQFIQTSVTWLLILMKTLKLCIYFQITQVLFSRLSLNDTSLTSSET